MFRYARYKSGLQAGGLRGRQVIVVATRKQADMVIFKYITGFTTRADDFQYWAGSLVAFEKKWLKRALGVGRKCDRSKE